MQRTSIALLLAASGASTAQQGLAPHERLPKTSLIAAHHVRLEGSAFQEQQWALMKLMQATCAEKMNKSVQLPPPSTALLKVVSDEYYTETHFVNFKTTTSTFINAQCELDSKTVEEVEVKHPFGNCQLNPAKKTATGQCAKDYGGTPIPGKTNNSNRQSLGIDHKQNCNTYQWQLGRLQQTACIQSTNESWRSLTVRGGGELAGLWLSNRIRQEDPDLITSIDLKATAVEKNIQVSRDLLNIAGTQGYKIIEIRLR